MGSKHSANSAGSDKPVKRARNVITLQKKLNVVNRLGHRESAASVAILASIRRHGTHRFIYFVGRRLCYVC